MARKTPNPKTPFIRMKRRSPIARYFVGLAALKYFIECRLTAQSSPATAAQPPASGAAVQRSRRRPVQRRPVQRRRVRRGHFPTAGVAGTRTKACRAGSQRYLRVTPEPVELSYAPI